LKNLEDRSLEINETQPKLSKGVNSNLNYIPRQGVSYDMEYAFPLKYFADFSNLNVECNGFEAVVSEGKDMLILRDENSLGLSVTMNETERRFMEQFDNLKDILEKKSIPLTMINFRTPDGSNLFHFLVQNIKALKKFRQNYMKFVDQFEDADERARHLELFLLILYPNNMEISPFDMGIKMSSQFVDIFL
jgi:hypothetical protein